MNNIILIGFMGCGKSTVGVKLSYRLKKTYLDTDKIIEKEQNQSIPEIFTEKGEGYFRQLEKECLVKLIEENADSVISVGGGLPIMEGNKELLKKLGTVIYLQISPEGIYKRLENDTTRPLLQVTDPLSRIRELMEARKERYIECADFVINVEDKTFEVIIQEIQEALNENTCD
jgi:shikimate kinase